MSGAGIRVVRYGNSPFAPPVRAQQPLPTAVAAGFAPIASSAPASASASASAHQRQIEEEKEEEAALQRKRQADAKRKRQQQQQEEEQKERKLQQEKEEQQRIRKAEEARAGVKRKMNDIDEETKGIHREASQLAPKQRELDQLNAKRKLTTAERERKAALEKETEAHKQTIRAHGAAISAHGDELATHVQSLHEAHRDAIDQKIERGVPVVDKNGNLERTLADNALRNGTKNINTLQSKGARIATETSNYARSDRLGKEAAQASDAVGRAVGASSREAVRPVSAEATGERMLPTRSDTDRAYDKRIEKERLEGSGVLFGKKGANKLADESEALHDTMRGAHKEMTSATASYRAARDKATSLRSEEVALRKQYANAKEPEKSELKAQLDAKRAERMAAEKETDQERERVQQATKRVDETNDKLERNAHDQYAHARTANTQLARVGKEPTDEEELALTTAHERAERARGAMSESARKTRTSVVEQGELEKRERAKHDEADAVRNTREKNENELTEIASRKDAQAARKEEAEVEMRRIAQKEADADAEQLPVGASVKQTKAFMEKRAKDKQNLARERQAAEKELKLSNEAIETDEARERELTEEQTRTKGDADRLEQEADELRTERTRMQEGVSSAQSREARDESFGHEERAYQLSKQAENETDPEKKAQLEAEAVEAKKAAASAREQADAMDEVTRGSVLRDEGIDSLHRDAEESIEEHEDEAAVLHRTAKRPAETDEEAAEAAKATALEEEEELGEPLGDLPSEPGGGAAGSETSDETAAAGGGSSLLEQLGNLGVGGGGGGGGFGGGGGGDDMGAGMGGMGMPMGGGGVGISTSPGASPVPSDNEDDGDGDEDEDGDGAGDDEENDGAIEGEETKSKAKRKVDDDDEGKGEGEDESMDKSESEKTEQPEEEQEKEDEDEDEPDYSTPPLTPAPTPPPRVESLHPETHHKQAIQHEEDMVLAQGTPYAQKLGMSELNPLQREAESLVADIPIIGHLVDKIELTHQAEMKHKLEKTIEDRRLAHVRLPFYVVDEEAIVKYSAQLPSINFQGELLVTWTDGENNGEHLIRMYSPPDNVSRIIVKEMRHNSGELFVLVSLKPAWGEPAISINTDWLSYCRESEPSTVVRAVRQIKDHTADMLFRLLSKQKRKMHVEKMNDEPKQLLLLTSRTQSPGSRLAPAAGLFGSRCASLEYRRPARGRAPVYVPDFGTCVYDNTARHSVWEGPGVRIRDEDGVLLLDLLFREATHPDFYMYEYQDEKTRCTWRFRFDKTTLRLVDVEYLIPLSRYMHF